MPAKTAMLTKQNRPGGFVRFASFAPIVIRSWRVLAREPGIR